MAVGILLIFVVGAAVFIFWESSILQGNRVDANEASAIASLRTISASQELYISLHGHAATVAELAQPAGGSATDQPLIPEDLASGEKSGYLFRMVSAGNSFQVVAEPSEPGVTGRRFFFLDETGIVRWNLGGSANSTSTPLE